MARTRKDRKKWKGKERKRTGKSDPKKIKLHRTRFLRRKGETQRIEPPKKFKTFSLRLKYNPADNSTKLFFNNKSIATIPFLVEDIESCYYAIWEDFPEFDPEKSSEVFENHLARVKATKRPCHFEKKVGSFNTCEGFLNCVYRKWHETEQIPECTK